MKYGYIHVHMYAHTHTHKWTIPRYAKCRVVLEKGVERKITG